MNARCTGSRPPGGASPSTVRTVWPSAIAASTVQDFTGTSSSHTTHAPQLDVSQPQWVPVSPSSSRSRCTSSSRGSTSRRSTRPLTTTRTSVTPPPCAVRAPSARPPGGACSRRARAGRRSDGSAARRAAPPRRRSPRSAAARSRLASASAATKDPTAVSPIPASVITPSATRSAAARRGDRPVPRPPVDLDVGAARRPQRHPQLHEHLGGPHRRLVGPEEELPHRHRAGAPLAADHRFAPAARRTPRTGPRTGRPGTPSRRPCRGCARSRPRCSARRRAAPAPPSPTSGRRQELGVPGQRPDPQHVARPP